jgi:hypothetical protein
MKDIFCLIVGGNLKIKYFPTYLPIGQIAESETMNNILI